VNTEPETTPEPTGPTAVDPAMFRPRLTLAEANHYLGRKEEYRNMLKRISPLNVAAILTCGAAAIPVVILIMVGITFHYTATVFFGIWALAGIAISAGLWDHLLFKVIFPGFATIEEVSYPVATEAKEIVSAAEAADAPPLANQITEPASSKGEPA
jgi:hypothetical protein